MKNKPKQQLTEEERLDQAEAWDAFDVKPYLNPMARIISNSPCDNEVGGVAVDLARAWMAVPCPHSADYHYEIRYINSLLLRLTQELESWGLSYDPKRNSPAKRPASEYDFIRQHSIFPWRRLIFERGISELRSLFPEDPLAPLFSKNYFPSRQFVLMRKYAEAWLPSYRACYRKSSPIPPAERLRRLECSSLSEEEKERKRREIELEKNCPYDPARIDERKLTDLLLDFYLDFPNSKEPVPGIPFADWLGQVIFDAYPECGSPEEYMCVARCIYNGMLIHLMKKFPDSRRMRTMRMSPMELSELPDYRVSRTIDELCRVGRADGRYALGPSGAAVRHVAAQIV
ncbi:MAG: hypothetical protein J6S75_00590 [Thermoguttaceae bacterium]|nr:hypothetical protein [Thermoguttaceae bacterium]